MIVETPNPDAIDTLLAEKKKFVRSGKTQSYTSRRLALLALRQAIITHQTALSEALARDLGKSPFEAYTNEIGLVLHEIRHTLRHLKRWMRPRRPLPEIFLQPSSVRVDRLPYGCALIIAPWNFPVLLTLSPLVAAIAAGNTAVVKPSEFTPSVEAVLLKTINEAFSDRLVSLVSGGPEETSRLIDAGFDLIFFTGSTAVGKTVMQKAATTLTPVVLELGGKNPAVIAPDASLNLAARQIAFSKFNNAGQACVATDYVLVPHKDKEQFIALVIKAIHDFYGDNPAESPDFGRIVNERHVRRLTSFFECGVLRAGGVADTARRYVAPTILDEPSWDSPVMQEEIFGPILPVIGYNDLEEALERVDMMPDSLARYAFSHSRATLQRIMDGLGYGGGINNGCYLHVSSEKLPFGGIGPSGMGSYHGRAGFDCFTRARSLLSKPARLDLPLAYPHRHIPLAWIKRFMR